MFRINLISVFKPEQGIDIVYTYNSEVFDYFDSYQDTMLHDIPPPLTSGEEEIVLYQWLHDNLLPEQFFPLTLDGEVTIFTK